MNGKMIATAALIMAVPVIHAIAGSLLLALLGLPMWKCIVGGILISFLSTF